MMDFYNQTLHVARKEHECEFCTKKILLKEKYSYETGKYDGDFFTRKLCIPCFNMLRQYCDQHDDEEFDWWWIQDWLHDEYCEKCSACDECDEKPQKCNRVRKMFAYS